MITGKQITSARALIGWDMQKLALACGVSVADIQSLENSEIAHSATAADIAQVLEAQGVVFVADGDMSAGGHGVRLKERSSDEQGLRPEELNATNDG